MNDLNLGHIITEERNKDAIHIAIAPVTAGEKLSPGDHVGFLPDGTAGEVASPIGVVDPFLRKIVKPGERFWMFLNPGSITALRHEWTHPSFEIGADQSKAAAQVWVNRYARELGVSPADLLQAANDFIERDDYWVEGGRFEGWDVSPEFWPHYEALTGKTVEASRRRSFFSCSC